jgi:hypothetical protein
MIQLFSFNVDGKDIVVLLARSPEIYWKFAMLIFDCWQQASIQYSSRGWTLSGWFCVVQRFPPLPSLAYIMSEIKSEGFNVAERQCLDEDQLCAPVRDQVRDRTGSAVNLRVLEQVLWQRSSDVPAQPILIYVTLTYLANGLYMKTVVWKSLRPSLPATCR